MSEDGKLHMTDPQNGQCFINLVETVRDLTPLSRSRASCLLSPFLPVLAAQHTHKCLTMGIDGLSFPWCMPLQQMAQKTAEPMAKMAAKAAAAAAKKGKEAQESAGKAAGEVAKVASALILNSAQTCGMKRCFLSGSDANKIVKFRLYRDRVQIVPGKSSNCDTGIKTVSH